MTEHPRSPRPHGDPLRETVEPNQAQQQSDASGAASPTASDVARDREPGSTSGMPGADEDEGETRRRQYAEGAAIVSKTD